MLRSQNTSLWSKGPKQFIACVSGSVQGIYGSAYVSLGYALYITPHLPTNHH